MEFAMALIQCQDCGREVSDRAAACLNCGAPIAAQTDNNVPTTVTLDGKVFVGTKPLLTRLAVRAIQSLNYRVDSADEAGGLVSFTTGMTWGSWSGVTGSLYFEEVEPHRFHATGNAKQNVKGGQVLAMDLFGEAKSKVQNVVDEMRRLVG
jgi:hypothetical protein